MVIALLTDFGTRDYFAASMKGAILTINEDVKITDITHDIPARDVRSAYFTLRACYKTFPENTIFAAVVDPGVGSDRRAIIVETSTQLFIAPDNGLLSFIYDDEVFYRVYEIQTQELLKNSISNTFHGRDVFAPVAAQLSLGKKARKFGVEIKDFIRFEQIKPKMISKDQIEAQILHIDHFGNIVTNLTAEYLPKKFALSINDRTGRKIERLRGYYSESEPGEVFLIVGSTGYIEIASNQSSAERLLGAEINDLITLKTL